MRDVHTYVLISSEHFVTQSGRVQNGEGFTNLLPLLSFTLGLFYQFKMRN